MQTISIDQNIDFLSEKSHIFPQARSHSMSVLGCLYPQDTTYFQFANNSLTQET